MISLCKWLLGMPVIGMPLSDRHTKQSLTQTNHTKWCKVKVKVSRNRPGQAQGVPDRLRSRIFLTFGTTKGVGRQPYEPAAFTPGEIPGTHF